jgi:hypothetical protein
MTLFKKDKSKRKSQSKNNSSSISNPFCFLAICLLLTATSFASTTVSVDQNKRISVAISDDSMNRIAFANDRISQVFGDEEAYTMQTDETRGQIFLKPTEANAEKPITITVTTENGVVQDLELNPKKMSTATIILKGEKMLDIKPSPDAFMPRGEQRATASFGSHLPMQHIPYHSAFSQFYGGSGMGGDRASSLTKALKEVACQDIPDGDGGDEKPISLKADGLAIEGIRVVHTNGFAIAVYRVTNTSSESRELVENALAGKQVLAIATLKRFLQGGETTLLFVARPIEQNT